MSVRPPRLLGVAATGTVPAVASLAGMSGAAPAEPASIAVIDPSTVRCACGPY
ncbi:hypothetical protein [Micromonospora sp. SL4-19]|uniref:hypothetical protein n=1 Tax=Micromonospora sp. SL4-19 TaxID=3399129 RepID=UPI003A4D978B